MTAINTQIYDEASEWIILHRTDSLDVDARRRFDAWLRESPQHLRAYLEMSTIWEDVSALNRDWNPNADQLVALARQDLNVFPLDPLSRAGGRVFADIAAVPVQGAETSALAVEVPKEPELQTVPDEFLAPDISAEPKLRPVPVVTVKAPQDAARIKLLAIAATVLIAIATSWLYLQRGVYATDIGEQRTIALLDGSTIELNARTKVRVRYTDHERSIDLIQGQALFKVAKDANRPFIVDSEGTRVRAVGTQFDVYKKTTGTQVTVVEGRVAVAAPSTVVPASGDSGLSGPSRAASRDDNAGTNSTVPRSVFEPASHALQAHVGEVLLSAGEQILIAQSVPPPEFAAREPKVATVPGSASNAGTVPTPQPANIEAATAWTQQRLIFDFTPLTEVAEEFNRYNRRPLVIDDSSLETFNISGSFSSTDPTLLLRFLREQTGIVVTETPSEIRISRQAVPNG